MSAFKVNPTKKPVDPQALAAFTAGAEVHQPTARPPSSTAPSPADGERQTESILFRLTKAQLADFNFVFENTNIKSKQKLLEAIILPEIRRRVEALKGENR